MKLQVHERLALVQLLPKEGTYAAVKSLRKAREIFSFTPDELKLYNIRTESGGVKWDQAKDQEVVLDAPIEEYIMDLIRQKLMDMDKKGKLTEQYISLFDKFVLTYRSLE